MLFRKTILSMITLFMAVSGMPVYAEEAPAPEVTERKNDAAASTETESVLGVKKLYAEEPETLTTGQKFNEAIKTLAAKNYSDFDFLINTVQVVDAVPSGSTTTKDVSAKQDGSYLAWWDEDTKTIKLYSKSGNIVLNPDSSSMFNNCTSLTTLDLSGWNTSLVTDMGKMFYDCYTLATLDVSKWNTGSVTNMGGTFYDCSKLSTLDVSNWNTGSVTNMNDMFERCDNLTALDVSKWDTSQVTNMSGMFYYCRKLTTLNVSLWKTGSVTNMSSMFNRCDSLTTLDLSGWNTNQVTDMSSMFDSCSSLAHIYIGSGWNTDKVTSSSSMFSGCTNLHNFNSSVVDKTNANADPNTGYMEIPDRFKVPYSVHFDKNAVDASGTMGEEAFASGEKKALTANSYVRDGFAFRSWNTKADGTGKSFADGATVSYLTTETSITLYAQWKNMNVAYSHTSNIDDNGTQHSSYGNNWSNANITGTDRGDTSKAHVITIPGAKTIKVTITYGGESDRYDYACVWKDAHPDYTASNNSSSSISGKLGGGSHTSASNTKTYTIEGNTVTFGFRSDGSGSGDGYGYYAVVEKVS